MIEAVRDAKYPRALVYDLFDKVWGIDKGDVFLVIAADHTIRQWEGKNPGHRGRTLFNCPPKDYVDCSFKPFAETAVVLVSLMHSAGKGPRTNKEIVDFMAGEASNLMATLLSQCGFDAPLYANTVADIARDAGLSETDKAELLVLLFCAAGCTGDVADAVRQMSERNRAMGTPARFVTMQNDDAAELKAENPDLALSRTGVHVLNTGPEGTVIGRQAIGEHAIADVEGGSVSKSHARVWRDEEGLWWVEGLGSTHGTELLDGGTLETITVEPPMAEREPGAAYGPVRIQAGDILILAKTTKLMVIEAPGDARS